jgi:hypothetical protein
LEWGKNKSVARGVGATIEKWDVVDVRRNEYNKERQSNQPTMMVISLDIADGEAQE